MCDKRKFIPINDGTLAQWLQNKLLHVLQFPSKKINLIIFLIIFTGELPVKLLGKLPGNLFGIIENIFR